MTVLWQQWKLLPAQLSSQLVQAAQCSATIHTENKLSSDKPGYILIGHKYQCYIKPTVIFVSVLWLLKISLPFRKGSKWEWGDLLKLLRYQTLPSGKGGFTILKSLLNGKIFPLWKLFFDNPARNSNISNLLYQMSSFDRLPFWTEFILKILYLTPLFSSTCNPKKASLIRGLQIKTLRPHYGSALHFSSQSFFWALCYGRQGKIKTMVAI